MDDIVYRPRYSRQYTGQQTKRRSKRSKREKDDFAHKLIIKTMRQALIGIIIFAVIAAIININSPQTTFLEDKIKGVLAYDIDFKDISGGVKSVQSVFKNLTEGKEGIGADGLVEDDSKDLGEDITGNSTFTGTKVQESYGEDLEPVSAVYTDEGSLVESMEYDNGLDKNAEDENAQESQEQVEEDSIGSDQIFGVAGYSFIIPIGGIIGSFYGERLHPIKNTILFHKGIDIEAQSGAPIKAAYDGEVLEADKEETYGNYVKIKHVDGLTTLYAHCSKLLVSKGQKVNKGDVIAEVGCTGAADGPHLHFEVRKDNEPVNPLDYINLSDN
ncbi:MAG: Murein DD-endopeptidase MepM [Firmicutes bacterium ADurb.Bin419]|nr:MAG: Murein DD-endopeptidase MepM [Firmicutes bacterium ADurb.Bin419]